MNASPDDVPKTLALELAAFEAWPAEEVVELGGWRLRAMGGVTRRANSAWTAETCGELALGERVAAVEAFYGARGLPSQFMLSPLSDPALDAELEARGYRVDSPVAIRVARAAELAALEPSHGARVEARPSAAFLEVSVERGRYRNVKDRFLGLLSRLGERARYATVEIEGVAAGVGLGVFSGSLFGLFAMSTLPEFRRRGVARAVALQLSREAFTNGARHVYLQVERDNAAAGALYERLGFREPYGYHYRVATHSGAG